MSVALGMLVVFPLRAQAQQDQPPPAYLAEYSNVPMMRNAAVLDSSLRIIERGADWAGDTVAGDLFARKSAGGFFARVGRSLFDFVLTGTGSVVAHEYGHMTRAEEAGREGTVTIRLFTPSFSGFAARHSRLPNA